MTYTELAGSPRESLSESSGSSAERKFLVPWTSRLTFAQALVSTATAYPHFPQARVVAIDIVPWMEQEALAGDVIVSPELATAGYGTQPALITVKYGPDFTQKVWPMNMPKPDIRFGTELRFQIRGSGKFITIPSAATKWDDDPPLDPPAAVPEDTNSAILIPIQSIQLQWDFVDEPPITVLKGLLGKVNSVEFLGAAEECLLFESYEITETFRAGVANPHTNRVTIQFSERQIPYLTGFVGWNHDYREDPAGWARLLTSDGEPRYKVDDFTNMFA